ncbi:MAG: tetratricopeptide repeat protein, partial [Xanthomonadales bacterium]|nr:tetratricopeptide repeat protein [Xanthomonadales bacterium]
MSLFAELKRRNVIRVATAYVVAAWLIIQVVETIFPAFGFGDTAVRLVVILLAIGFLPTLVISWFFEITPQGWRKEADVVRDQTITRSTGRKLNAAIILLLVLALGYFAFDKFALDPARDRAIAEAARSEAAAPRPPERTGSSIAVLPFANRSGSPENAWFTDGMHDELLTRLSRISALKVISRTSVLRYRDGEQAIPEIAAELGVATVLEGGVQRVGDQVRVNVQLIDGETDEHLWAEIYDRRLSAENLFEIQSDISRAIAAQLSAQLSADEDRALRERSTENLAAYDAYLRGLAELERYTLSAKEKAVEQFTRATGLDPDFAAAWAGLCEAELGRYGTTRDRKAFDAAERACHRALELDDQLLEVHVALAALHRTSGLYSRAEVTVQQAEFHRAEAALERAFEIDSLSLLALIERGLVRAAQGRLDEAQTDLRRAAEADPAYWPAQTSLFNFYYGDSNAPDRYEQALRAAVQAAAIRPDLAASWNNVGSAHYMLGDYRQAADAWKKSLEIEPTRTGFTNTGLALAYDGQFAEAAAMQEKAAELAPQDYRVWGRLGEALNHLPGAEARAAEAFRRAVPLARDRLEINPEDWRTRAYLATYLAWLGELEEAAELSGNALSASERHPEALLCAADVAYARGETESYL